MCKSTVAPSSAKSRRPNDIRGACVRHSRRCACPRLNRDDLRRLPIEQRKEPAGLLRGSHPGVVLNEHYKGDGEIVFKHACKLGCEGIVSKRLGSPYRSGRVAHWLKIKNPAAPAVTREAEDD